MSRRLVEAAYSSLDGQAMRAGIKGDYVVKFSPEQMLWVYVEPERLVGEVVTTGLAEDVWKPHATEITELIKTIKDA